MQRELYFDIHSEESGGSLYRIPKAAGGYSFLYHHSTYDEYRDETRVFQTPYASFADFWKELTKNPQWFYLHPLYIHPEQRPFIQEQLKTANWSVHPNLKWQQSHQRQWTKVLTDPADYYRKLQDPD